MHIVLRYPTSPHMEQGRKHCLQWIKSLNTFEQLKKLNFWSVRDGFISTFVSQCGLWGIIKSLRIRQYYVPDCVLLCATYV